MPWLPSRSSSQAITRAIGTRGWPSTGGSSPTWTWRPRRRRLEDRVGAGLLAADGVDGDVAAAVGEVGDRGRDVGAVGQQRRARRPSAVADGEGLGLRSTATTRAPRARAIITALSPTPPAPTTRHPLARPHPGPADQRAVRRGEPAAQARPRWRSRRLGHGDQVGVGGVQGDHSANDPQWVKPGCCWSGQTWASPARHHSHRPQPQTNGTVTRSPTRQPRDAGADLRRPRRRARGPARAGRRCRRARPRRASRCGTSRWPSPGRRPRPSGAAGSGTSRTSGTARTASTTTARTRPSSQGGDRGRDVVRGSTLVAMTILDSSIARLDGSAATLGELTGGTARPAGQRREQVRPHPAVHRPRAAPGEVRRARVHRRRAAVQPVHGPGARVRRGDRRSSAPRRTASPSR